MNGCWLKEREHAAVNEVLDPWLILSGEEGPNPGERSKNEGIIGQPESSLCSPGKIVLVTVPWVGRLGKQESLMLKNCEGQWQWEGWQAGSEGKGACRQAWCVQTSAPTWEKRINNNPAIFLCPSQMGACVYTSTYIHNK